MYNLIITMIFFISIFNPFKIASAIFNGHALSIIHANDAPYPWQVAFQDPASPGFVGRATARVCTELLKCIIKDNPEGWVEDHNTHFITVKGEGQEPVLKGAMRLKIARGFYQRAKTSFEVI